jgi:hypothetical protein
MTHSRRASLAVITALAAILLPASRLPAQSQESRRPTIIARATPPVGFTPLRVRASAELRDGSDDYAEFYCATVEWEWDDGTTSESSSDCDPYESGKSTIQRRFSAEHTYRQGGAFRIVFRLKQKNKQVGSANVTVQVRSGAGGAFAP